MLGPFMAIEQSCEENTESLPSNNAELGINIAWIDDRIDISSVQ